MRAPKSVRIGTSASRKGRRRPLASIAGGDTAQVFRTLYVDATLDRLSAMYSGPAGIDVGSVEELLRDLETRVEVGHESRFVLLIQLANCFEAAGCFDKALEVVLQALQLARAHLPMTHQRQAHNGAAVFSFRLLDFEAAFSHLEEGLRIAEECNDAVGRLALLCNAAVLFEALGSVHEAMRLCSLIIDGEHEGPSGTWLALQASINGALMSRRHTNDDDFNHFHDVACELIETARGSVPEEWLGLHEANQVYALLSAGNAVAAWELARSRVAAREYSNTRSMPRLICMLTMCCIKLGDAAGLKKCRSRLRRVLKTPNLAAICREEILQVLVKSYLADVSDRAQRLALIAMRMLREHLIVIKHGQFYRAAQAGFSPDEANWRWKTSPRYQIPDVICRGFAIPPYVEGPRARMLIDDEFETVFSQIASLEATLFKTPVRSFEYTQAENWAILVGSEDAHLTRHGWLVGRMARLLAEALGWTEIDAGRLELACRLHDVGRVFGPVDETSRPFNEFRDQCVHTVAGG